MKVLVIGLGSIGQRHAANATALGHEVHVHDVDAAAYKVNRWNWHESIEAAYRIKPDAVIIATPASTHLDFLGDIPKKCLLFIEKPLALSRGEVWTKVPVERREGLKLAVGYQLRFHPHVRALKVIAEEMQVKGGISAAVAWVADAGKTWPGLEYADALLECSHEIDTLHYLLGPAAVTYADASESRETWNVAMLFEGGIQAKVHLSTEAAKYERYTTLIGMDGKYAWWGWHGPSGKSVLIRPDKSEETLEGTTVQVYKDEMEAFLDGAQLGCCTFEEAMQVLGTCDAARRKVVGGD